VITTTESLSSLGTRASSEWQLVSPDVYPYLASKLFKTGGSNAISLEPTSRLEPAAFGAFLRQPAGNKAPQLSTRVHNG
jgi:hypothetical protein